MTTPAKPPAPMEPLKPCHSCGSTPERAAHSESARCSDRACFMSVYWTPISQWNRRAAPAPTDGEVGELVREIEAARKAFESCECEVRCKHEQEFTWQLHNKWERIAAALSRQSAELAEAREREKKLIDWSRDQEVRIMDAVPTRLCLAYACDPAMYAGAAISVLDMKLSAAVASLTALGCKLGPDGRWYDKNGGAI